MFPGTGGIEGYLVPVNVGMEGYLGIEAGGIEEYLGIEAGGIEGHLGIEVAGGIEGHLEMGDFTVEGGDGEVPSQVRFTPGGRPITDSHQILRSPT